MSTDSDFKKELNNFISEFDPFFEEYFMEEVKRLNSPYSNKVKDIFDLFSSVALRKGKRIRPVLVYFSYEMLGGKDKNLAFKVGAIIELLHAHWLVIDDVFDKSDLRRGEPTAHKLAGDFIEKYGLEVTDIEHFTNSIGVVAGLMGGDFAYNLLAGLDVDDAVKIKLFENITERMFITSGGEGLDVLNSQNFNVSEDDIGNMMYMKTAVYSFENPLHCGAILAGAGDDVLDVLSEYAKGVGVAFQIRDDLLGMFGNPNDTGKSNKDDLEEGKMTLLMQYGLTHLNSKDREVLVEILKKKGVTDEDHEIVKNMLVDCGAVDYCKNKIAIGVKDGTDSLKNLRQCDTGFLGGLARYVRN